MASDINIICCGGGVGKNTCCITALSARPWCCSVGPIAAICAPALYGIIAWREGYGLLSSGITERIGRLRITRIRKYGQCKRNQAILCAWQQVVNFSFHAFVG